MRIATAPAAALLLLAACGRGTPCESSYFRRAAGYGVRFAGHWVVVRGDTVTLPEGMGLPFRLTDIRLDTARLAVGQGCFHRGSLAFSVPRVETLAVTWLGEPGRALVYGWPAELGPFAGLEASTFAGGDSLSGAILFDERLGVRMQPGVTAQFVAARAP